ncbi:hypothetical protein llap_22310 [Limosa lapponica baueri]|uniref:Secreted protein n=1 Tax=Limosa lapponica baueri TaxID=1758121 RepID=A0A2I0T0S2_LIMLA|nr:hypothetical protein llap_22310 [Limosa lapponica baueri]
MEVRLTGLVVSRVFLLALFEDWDDIGFPPVLRHLACSPGPFEDDGEWPSKDFCQLPQHLRVHPIRTHGLVGIHFT